MGQSVLFRAAAVIVFIVGLIYLLSVVLSIVGFLSELILTVFFAWIVAANIHRLALWVKRFVPGGLGSAVAVAYLVVLVPTIVFLAFIVPVTVGQVIQLAGSLPAMVENAPRFLEGIQSVATRLGIQVDLASAYPQDSLTDAMNGLNTWMSDNALAIAGGTLGLVLRVVLILILSVYFVADGTRLGGTLRRLLPDSWHDEADFIYSAMNTIFQGWLRGVVVVSAVFAIFTLAIMLVLGIPYAVPIALMCGLILILPLIGDPIAIFLPAVAALQTGNYGAAAIIVVALFLIDSFLIRNYLYPRVMGSAVNLPVSLVFLSVLFGAQIAGLWGAMLGVPIFAMVYSLAIAFADRAKSGAAQLQPVADDV